METYSPCSAYCPPIGRIAVLGKVRAEVDKIRTDIVKIDADVLKVFKTIEVDDSNMAIRLREITNTEYKTTQEMQALRDRTSTELQALRDRTATEMQALRDRTETELEVLVDKTVADIASLEAKTESETRLLDQKAITELAQTSDYIPNTPGMNNTNDVQGTIKKQKDLFGKQADGFDRDAEQKLAKIMVDTWSVRKTTDDSTLATPAGLGDPEIHAVLQKAKAGIN